MRFQPQFRLVSYAVAVAAVSGLLIAGCGSSGSGTKPRSHASSPASSSGMAAAESQIKANWMAFFAAGTPVSKRVTLLQNGPTFRALIQAQSKSPLASEASAKVTKVSSITSSQADVTYSIDVAGTSALSGQHGIAVHQDGTWKVGDRSFCTLLGLESGGKSKLPAACSSAA